MRRSRARQGQPRPCEAIPAGGPDRDGRNRRAKLDHLFACSPWLRKERMKLLWRATRCRSGLRPQWGHDLNEAYQGICGSLGHSSVWLVVCTPQRQRGKQR